MQEIINYMNSINLTNINPNTHSNVLKLSDRLLIDSLIKNVY